MLKSLKHKEKRFLFWLFIIAFTLRLGFTLVAKQHYFFYDSPGSDVVYYQEWAKEIATQDFIGKKVFSGLPLYPYFLSFIHRLSLGHPEVMRLFHLLLGSLNCLLLYFLAKKLFSLRVAVLASILMCFNFFMIYYDWLMMPVTLIITLSLIILLALFERDKFSLPRQWIILGTLIGLAILGDGKFLFFTLLFPLWLWINEPRHRKNIIIMTITALTILGLCTVRNKLVSGNWVLISAQNGLSLYAGNNPNATGTYTNPSFIRPTHRGQDEDQKIMAEAIVNRSMTSKEISTFWKTKAFDFIKNHPADYAKLLVKKFSLFLRETENAHDMDLLFLREWKYRINWNALFIIFPLALIGIFISFQKWKHEPAVIFLILCQLIITLIFFLSTRHRATILPFLLMFEATAIFWLLKQFRQRHIQNIIFSMIFIGSFSTIFYPITMDAEMIDYNRFAKAGAVFDKRGDLKNAKENLYKALNYVPGDSNTLYNLGNVYFQEGNLIKAKQMYQASLKVCHYNVDAIFNLAFVLDEMGEKDLAMEKYKEVNHYQPDIPDVYFRMANIYANTGECVKAIPLYQKVIQLNPILQSKIQEYIDRCR